MRYLKISLVVILAGLLVFAGVASAEFPEREIEVVVPWAAGGGTDRLARFMGDQMSERLDVPVVVNNRTGGDGAIGHSVAAFADPDGYTIGNITMELSTIEWLGLSEVNYEYFEPVIQFNADPAAVIVREDAPWDNVNELLEDVAENPDDFDFSGSATGSVWDLARVGMLNEYGIDPQDVVWIPTEGAAPALTELMGGHVDVLTISYAEAIPQIEAGEVRALAVMSEERLDMAPDTPTLLEEGIDWTAGTWRGFAVPQGTPQEVVDSLYETALDIVESEEFVNYMEEQGFGIEIRGPEEFREFLEEDYYAWEDALRAGGYID